MDVPERIGEGGRKVEVTAKQLIVVDKVTISI